MCNFLKSDSFDHGFVLVVILDYTCLAFLAFFNQYLMKIPLYYHLINKCLEPSFGSQKSLAFQFASINLLEGSLMFLQFIYVIPLIMILRREQQWETQKGVIVGSVITVLCTASCFSKCHFY